MSNATKRSDEEIAILGPLLDKNWDNLSNLERALLLFQHECALILVNLKRVGQGRGLPPTDQDFINELTRAQLIEATVRHAMALPEVRQPKEIELLGRFLVGDQAAWENLSEAERNALIARHDKVIRVCKALENIQPGSEAAKRAAVDTTPAERIRAQEAEARVRAASDQNTATTPDRPGNYWENLLNLPPDRGRSGNNDNDTTPGRT